MKINDQYLPLIVGGILFFVFFVTRNEMDILTAFLIIVVMFLTDWSVKDKARINRIETEIERLKQKKP